MSLLGRVFNQINPFDNGKTFKNTAPQKLQPRVNVQQLTNALQVHAVNNPVLVRPPPVPQTPPLQVHTAQPQILHMGQQQFTPAPGRTAVPTRVAPPPSVAHILTHNPITNQIGGQIQAVGHNINEAVQAATGNKQAQRQFFKDISPPPSTIMKNGKRTYNPEFVKYAQNIAASTGGFKTEKVPRPVEGKPPLPKQATSVTAPKSAKLAVGRGSGAKSEQTLKPPNEQFPVTTIDKVIANTTGETPQKVAAGRIQNARNADAERAAVEHLKGGGTRDEAIGIYKQAAGASQKKAAFVVQRAAKEAKQSLNTSKSIPNPLSDKFRLPDAQPGKHIVAPQNRNTINSNITRAEGQAYKIEKQLSPNDKANIAHYHEGTLDINKADNPALVKKAIAANTNLTDTVHALGEPYGRTPHIEHYFPRYLANAEDQSGKAQMAMEEAALAHKPIPLEDQGNYAGFHNKMRVFKTRAEAQAADFKLMHSNPYEDLRRYARGAKINLGDQAFTRAARQADENLNPETFTNLERQYPLRLHGGGIVSVGKKGYRALKNYQAPEPIGLGKKALRGINKSVVRTIVANPIFHGGNQEFNAVFQAAWRMPGFKIANMAKLVKNQAKVTSEDITNFYREGNMSPNYGKTDYGFIAKGLQKAGIDPAKAEISPRAMAAIEENIRVSLWKLGKSRNMSPEETTALINKTLGGPDIVGDFSASFGLFLHYLKTNVKLLGDTGVQALKGNVKPLAGLALGYTAWMAANKGWQEVTGNPNASVRAPGAIGVLRQFGKIPGQLAKGRIPAVVINHINPGITTVAEQVANRDFKRAVVGKKSQYNSLTGKYGSGRLKTAASNLVGPAGTLQDVGNQKTSPGNAALSLGLGLYNNPKLKVTPPSGNKGDSPLNKRQKVATDSNELNRWAGMTKKAQKNVQFNNPDKYIKDQQLQVQQDLAKGKTTDAFKATKTIAQTQIYRNYNKNLVQAYGLNSTDFKAFINQASPDDVNKLKSLDKQLVDKGLVAKSKFKGGSGGGRTAKVASLKVKLPPKPKAIKVGKFPKVTKTKSVKFKTPKVATGKTKRIRVNYS